ncbi:hypothetical protein JCM11641_004216 [Rhodosporidiobolus odoratus]
MKRSYNSSSAAPPPNISQQSPYAAAYAQPAAAAPPLPPGPPPPQPGATQYAPHYAAYAAPPQPQAQQTAAQAQAMAAHPQYPGYGYGQAATPATAASPYSSPAVPDPNAVVAAAAAQQAHQYAAYYAAYAAQAQQQAAAAGAASPYGAAPAPGYPPQPPQPAYGAPPPPPLSNQSPGAPPYKRTRYDQPPPPAHQPPLPPGPLPASMPPSILPPVGGRSGRGMDRGGGGRGGGRMGGYDSYGPGDRDRDRDRDRYDDRPPPPRGGSSRGGRGGGPRRPAGGRGVPPGMQAMGMGGGYGGGGGDGYGSGAPSGPRGGSGPRGPRGGDDRRSGGGGRAPSVASNSSAGRPMSGLPGSSKYGPSGAPRGPAVPTAPKGPKGLAAPSGSTRGAGVNQQAPRKERKWGAGSGSGAGPESSSRGGKHREDKEHEKEGAAKRTLTDFRIEGLSIPELEWEWKAERVEMEIKKAAEELERLVKEKEDATVEGEDSTAAEALSDPIAIKHDEQQEDVDGEEAADMSIDQIPPTAAAQQNGHDGDVSIEDAKPESDSTPAAPAEPTDSTSIASLATPAAPAQQPQPSKGKHRLDDDTYGASDDEDGDLIVSDANAEHAKEKEAREAKKVKVEEAATGADEEGEKVSLETLQPSQPHPEQVEVKPDEIASQDIAATEFKAKAAPVDDAPSIPPPPPSEPVPPPPAPPAPRENSRLRIYFSSPVTAASSYTVPVPPSSAPKGPASKAGSVPPVAQPLAQAGTESVVQEGNEKEKEQGGQAESAPTPAVMSETKEELTQPAPVAEVTEKTEEKVKAEEVQEKEEERDKEPAQLKEEERDKEPAQQEEEDVDGEAIDGEEYNEDDVDGEPLVASSVVNGDEAEPSAAPERPAQTGDAEENEEDEADLVVTKVEAPDSAPAGNDPAPTNSARETSLAPSTATVAQPSTSTTPLLLPPEPAGDRISISYARNTRRMLLDADVVEAVRILRGEARIELVVRCKPALLGGKEGEQAVEDEFRVCKGILVEALDPEADDYIVMDRTALELAWRPSSEEDPSHSPDALLPPLHRLLVAPPPATTADSTTEAPVAPHPAALSRETITVSAQLDKANPLTEARWVKTGEVESWILSLGISNGADPKDTQKLSDWRGKIKVVDPDAPPTIRHALDAWAATSNVGTLNERRDFVKNHMSSIDNVVEILLRLTRGDRAGPSHYSSSSGYQQAATVGALAATLDAPFPDQQTQVSLAVLAMFRLSVEHAQKAGIAQDEIEKQVSEIVRALPQHLIGKAVDGQFRDLMGKGGKGPRGGSGGKKGRRD